MAEKLGGRPSDNRRPPHSRLEELNPGCASNTSNTRGLSSQTHTQSAHLMADETKTIELRPCGYQATCNVKNCRAKASTLARAVDR
jgi:hypothetical protein